MAYADDFFSPQDRCEICGAELEDEVVIQEFADGSLARLCPECAAGTALDDTFTDGPLPEEKPAKKRRGFRLRGGRSKSVMPDEGSYGDEAPHAPEGRFAAEQAFADESPFTLGVGSAGQGLADRDARAVPDAPEHAVFDAQALFSETPAAAARPPAAQPARSAAVSQAPSDEAETTARIRGAAVKPASSKAKAKAAPSPAPVASAAPLTDAAAAPTSASSAHDDLLDKTRELLLPVTDLIVLQGEVQGALERLAASLERFAAELITDSEDKAQLINRRLQTLEQELDATRARLRETEALLPNMADLEARAKAEPSALPEEVQPVSIESLIAESRAAAKAAKTAAATVAPADAALETIPAAEFAAAEVPAADATPEATPEIEAEPEPGSAPATAIETEPAVEAALAEEELPPSEPEEIAKITWTPQDLWPTEIETPAEAEPPAEAESAPRAARLTEAELAAQADRSAEAYLAAQPRTVPLPGFGPSTPSRAVIPPPGKETSRRPAAAALPEEPAESTGNFRINEVQAAQRYYNESPFVNRIRDVRRSLGKPKASVVRLAGETPRAIITIYWDIVWYQYLVDLRRDLPSTEPRVVLHREGMSLDEIPFEFKEKNATVNDDGRLDASELEVHLLSDPSALITEMSQEETQIIEDATEEIWNQHGTPEFKWDD
jgi:hypothetical protein